MTWLMNNGEFKCHSSVGCRQKPLCSQTCWNKDNRESLNWSRYHWPLTTPLTNSFLGKQLCNCTCLRFFFLFILLKVDNIWYCIVITWMDGWILMNYMNFTLNELLIYHIKHFLLRYYFKSSVLFPLHNVPICVKWDTRCPFLFYKAGAYGQK